MPTGQHLKVDNPRNNTLSFKTTDDELKILSNRAEVLGISISKMIRVELNIEKV